jgi:hypothetical protein
MTRQGLRDLNYYGPKRVPATTATTTAPVADEAPVIAPIVIASELSAIAPKEE